ncbi:pleckstrin homology domain-containing family O member 1b [Lepisosteus oculatus]|uniref:pleckstrin homology domain-containing family O member 1b n=1 Tax=Lepisosteus oculatus TaxID=7918 RepID=UPI00371F1EFA
MKKSASAKRGPPDANQPPSQPEKIGWIRKFCGRGIFREIWRNRYVVLKGDQLYISEKEVKDEKKIQEVFDLTDYEKSEELRKSKSRSKKNHSKFTLLRCRQPGNTVPNLVFLAVSPEEKESWINALNGAITRAKNRIFDEVTVEEESCLAHPTRDRAKIPHNRRLPTRGHLMAVASTSTSDGMLTLDLIQEEDSSSPEGPPGTCEKSFRVDLDKSVSQLAAGRRRSETEGPQPPGPGGAGEGKAESPSRRKETSWERQKPEKGERGPAGARTPQVARRPGLAGKSKCASMEEILSEGGSRASPNSAPPQVQQLQDLIAQKLERTRELLAETRDRRGKDKGPDSEGGRAEAEQLLQEAAAAWGQARDVLQEVKELRALYQRLDPNPSPAPLSPSQLKSPQQSQYRKSMM